MSHLEEKEREFTIKSWCREIGLAGDEFMLFVDICLDEECLYAVEIENKEQVSFKWQLLNSLEQIYIRETHADERVRRLCLIAKDLYIKLLDISDEDILYIMKKIINAKELIGGVGHLLDSFWQENEVIGIDDAVIQNVCRARHLAYLQVPILG